MPNLGIRWRQWMAAALICTQTASGWAGLAEGWAAYQRGDDAAALREAMPLVEAGQLAGAELAVIVLLQPNRPPPKDVETALALVGRSQFLNAALDANFFDALARQADPRAVRAAKPLAEYWASRGDVAAGRRLSLWYAHYAANAGEPTDMRKAMDIARGLPVDHYLTQELMGFLKSNIQTTGHLSPAEKVPALRVALEHYRRAGTDGADAREAGAARTGYAKLSFLDPSPAATQTLGAFEKMGDLESQVRLAQRFQRGTGVARNPQQALRLFEAAAERGSAVAQREVGISYLATSKDTARTALAVQKLDQAARSRDAFAAFRLAIHYLEGKNEGVDITAARRYLQMAAQNGADQEEREFYKQRIKDFEEGVVHAQRQAAGRPKLGGLDAVIGIVLATVAAGIAAQGGPRSPTASTSSSSGVWDTMNAARDRATCSAGLGGSGAAAEWARASC